MGPSQFIRENCPRASTGNDGLMSSSDKVELAAATSDIAALRTEQYTKQTTSNEQVTQDIYTLPANSGALLTIDVVGVSSYFSVAAGLQAVVTIRRDGSGDGGVVMYELVREQIHADLAGVAISVGNTLTAGVLVLTITGKVGRPVYWTARVVAVQATQGQS
jgi:hypothetical protein